MQYHHKKKYRHYTPTINSYKCSTKAHKVAILPRISSFSFRKSTGENTTTPCFSQNQVQINQSYKKTTDSSHNENTNRFEIMLLYHISAIDWCGHFDFPVILIFSHELTSSYCCSATAVVYMEHNFTLIMLQKTCCRLGIIIPNPFKVCRINKVN